MNTRRLTILQVLPQLGMGGAERVAVEGAAAVHLSGHRALIAAAPGPLAALATRAGAELVRLPLDTKSPLGIWRNIRRLEEVIEENEVDLIHAHSRAPAWSAYHAARRRKIPFVTTYHGVYGEQNGLKRRYNQVMARGDRVIAVSHYVAELIRARYGVGEERVRVIHGGVDTAVFDPATVLGDRAVKLARAWRADSGQPTVVLPGRLTGWKGQKLFIEALAKMRNQEVLGVLVGSDQGRGAYTASLMRLAETLGVGARLRLTGHVEDVPAAMMLADVVVNCSTKPEAFGRTIVEAQAMGRVVVAADHGGARETVLDGQSGFLVPPGNAAALAAVLDAILEMPAQARIEFGQQARAHIVRSFSLPVMQTRLLNVYAELLG